MILSSIPVRRPLYILHYGTCFNGVSLKKKHTKSVCSITIAEFKLRELKLRQHAKQYKDFISSVAQ